MENLQEQVKQPIYQNLQDNQKNNQNEDVVDCDDIVQVRINWSAFCKVLKVIGKKFVSIFTMKKLITFLIIILFLVGMILIQLTSSIVFGFFLLFLAIYELMPVYYLLPLFLYLIIFAATLPIALCLNFDSVGGIIMQCCTGACSGFLILIPYIIMNKKQFRFKDYIIFVSIFGLLAIFIVGTIFWIPILEFIAYTIIFIIIYEEIPKATYLLKIFQTGRKLGVFVFFITGIVLALFSFKNKFYRYYYSRQNECLYLSLSGMAYACSASLAFFHRNEQVQIIEYAQSEENSLEKPILDVPSTYNEQTEDNTEIIIKQKNEEQYYQDYQEEAQVKQS